MSREQAAECSVEVAWSWPGKHNNTEKYHAGECPIPPRPTSIIELDTTCICSPITTAVMQQVQYAVGGASAVCQAQRWQPARGFSRRYVGPRLKGWRKGLWWH